MMPFAGGPDSLSNGTLLLSVITAFFYLVMLRRPASWRRTAVKAGSVALLAVLALLEGGPTLLVGALVMSALGDAFLAHDGEKAFLGGLASFLAAHLVYVALFAGVGAGIEILSVQPWRLALPMAVTLAALPLLRRLLPAAGPGMRAPVAIYAVAIIAMMWTSATVAAPVVMVGAALFVVSDAILAMAKFLFAPASRHHVWAAPAVWVLYYLAQVAITLGFIL